MREKEPCGTAEPERDFLLTEVREEFIVRNYPTHKSAGGYLEIQVLLFDL